MGQKDMHLTHASLVDIEDVCSDAARLLKYHHNNK
jgi:hypothetical protein